MLTLASMIYFAFAFVGAQTGMLNKVPMPVVVETMKTGYSYNEIEDAIYVPVGWQDDCTNQSLIVHYMALHYNNFKSGMLKMDDDRVAKIVEKWVCIK